MCTLKVRKRLRLKFLHIMGSNHRLSSLLAHCTTALKRVLYRQMGHPLERLPDFVTL